MGFRLVLAAALSVVLSGCRIAMETPTSGAVTTASGAYSCAPGQSCSIDVVDVFFSETFEAAAEDGFLFTGWEEIHRGLCGGSSEPCHLETSAFGALPALMAFLENPEETFYLNPTFQSEGFSSVFIGHSFFRPFAEALDEHAPRAGIAEHSAGIFFSGGASGAPEALWNNESKRAEIQRLLNAGDVDLFAMTYHPDYPSLRGYRLWIDYALAQNPVTRIAIALPWLTEPEAFSAEDYASAWHAFHEGDFHTGIDALRALYPDTEIFCLPYGQAAVELRTLFDTGVLADVSTLTSKTEDAIFRDALGHADDILLELGELIWLQGIYDVPLDSYSYEPPYEADLKALAAAILAAHDPAYDAPYR